MNKVIAWLEENNYNKSLTYEYEVGDKTIILLLDEVLKGAMKRLRYEEELINSLNKIKKYICNLSYIPAESSLEKEFMTALYYYLKDMGANEAYKNHQDFELDEYLDQYEDYDRDFILWLSNEQGITEHQLCCDHDESDQHSEDGMWYNSVGACKNCLVDVSMTIDHYEELDLIYKAWKYQK